MAKFYWITGLSGAGKTTIGKIFYELLKKDDKATIFLDGDAMRGLLVKDLGYSEADRRACTRRYAEIGLFFQEQDINVVMCTICMFHEARKWNRENIPDYVEIYVKTSMPTLISRDQKGLYSRTSEEIETVVSGVDFEFEEPINPDFVVENEGDVAPKILARQIYEFSKNL